MEINVQVVGLNRECMLNRIQIEIAAASMKGAAMSRRIDEGDENEENENEEQRVAKSGDVKEDQRIGLVDGLLFASPSDDVMVELDPLCTSDLEVYVHCGRHHKLKEVKYTLWENRQFCYRYLMSLTVLTYVVSR
jgi:hypothetical protein